MLNESKSPRTAEKREWETIKEYKEILFTIHKGIAKISINRPKIHNAFTPLTVEEMIDAMLTCRERTDIGVIILSGEGGKAFCSGGDQGVRGHGGYVGQDKIPRLNVLDLQKLIRSIPKPVIAMVAGWAIGGGHVLHVVCDLTIAADNARFGQTGPKVGSFDGGFGASYLARIVGQKKAREIWYLCDQYDAKEALDMGLVNKVVPLEQLEDVTVEWCNKILKKSPLALRMLKTSFNAELDGQAGLQELAGNATLLYYLSDEAKEGRDAFMEKREPDFSKFPNFPDPMSNVRAWVVSLRLRTLPLALASTGMGNFLAAGFTVFSLQTCLLTSLTAILLQILSNLANDYGDYKTGADNETRIGPKRALQSGSISISAMRNAIILVALLTLASGCILLYEATTQLHTFILFLFIGLLCIVAAVKYTMGKNPYGYSGFGDLAVFVFFGLIGVGGTFYLHAHYFHCDIFLPAVSLGLLSAGVLNVNNMRDITNDAATGKRTIVVRLGLTKAKIYHLFLIIISFSCLIRFTFLLKTSIWQWAFLLTLPLFIIHLVGIMKSNSAGMDKYLKQLAISTLILVLFFGISIALNPYV